MIELEVIATTVDDCRVAEECGAQRIELCCALELGGLTPSIATMVEARSATRLPIMAMVRPHGGGFVYSQSDFAVLERDARVLLDAGADGLVFGALLENGLVDADRCRRIVEIAARRPVTFHRAFDWTPDLDAALEVLVDLGVPRVLTSGGAPTCDEGAARIARLIENARGRIVVMPGGGVDEANLLTILQVTGCREVHGSFSARIEEPARPAGHTGKVTLSAAGPGYRRLDGARVRQARAILDSFASTPENTRDSATGAEHAATRSRP